MSLSRPTASKFASWIARTATVCVGLVGLTAAPALASKEVVLAECPGQTFSQPFGALNDSNYYTLVQGSTFNGPAEGWELNGGARVVDSTQPDGTSGSALDLPSGAEAVSPPVCVTLLYPTARVWLESVQGAGGVAVSVAYAGTKTAEQPKSVGSIDGQQGSWSLSEPFNVRPQIAGHTEETRQVRFHFATGGKKKDYRLYGLYVDPRMR